MGVIAKQGLKGTLFSYIGAFLGYANWVFLFPLFLAKSEMGFIRVLMDSALLLTTIFSFGIPQAIVKFYPFGGERFSRVYFSSFGLITLIAGLAYIPIFFLFKDTLNTLFSPKAELFSSHIFALLPIVLFGISFDFFEAMNRVRLNISGGIFIKEVLFRIIISVFILGYGLNLFAFEILVVMLIAAYAIQALGMALLFFRTWEPDESTLSPKLHSKEQFKYMALLFLGAGGTAIVNQIDSVMTGGMKGLDYAAVYAMAFFMSSVVYMPFRSVNSISNSVVAAHFAKNEINQLDKLYKSSSINLFVIGSVLFLGIWLNIDLIFSLIPESKAGNLSFSEGKWVFFILGLARLFDMLMGINGVILINSKYYISNIITMPLLAALTILTNLWLIPKIGINGAALASLISIIVFNLIRFLIIAVALKLQPFTIKSLIGILLFLAALFLGFLFKTDSIYLQLIYSIAIVGIVFCIPAYLLEVSVEVNNILKKYVARIIK